jgi:hypothetical protein
MTDNQVTGKPKDIMVGLSYPRVETNPDAVIVELEDVRAADSIKIQYDFERDGWIISQRKVTHPWISDSTYGYAEEWFEKAFLPAWPFGDGHYFIEKDGTERYEEN